MCSCAVARMLTASSVLEPEGLLPPCSTCMLTCSLPNTAAYVLKVSSLSAVFDGVSAHSRSPVLQVHGPTVDSVAAYAQHCADMKWAKAAAWSRKRQAAGGVAPVVAKEQVTLPVG